MKCNIKYLGVFHTPRNTKEGQMTGIIPFFHLEDPDDIRSRLDIKRHRKLTISKLRKAVRGEILEAHHLKSQNLPGQTLIPLTDVTWP